VRGKRQELTTLHHMHQETVGGVLGKCLRMVACNVAGAGAFCALLVVFGASIKK
jgi:hypothetical protein